MRSAQPFCPAWVVGEFAGTFLLVFFGCGSVAAAVLTGAQVGIFQVAIVWGLGIATAIYLTGGLSGAHLNPAVTLSLAAQAGFPWKRVPGYLAIQCLGAFAASAVLYVVFAGPLRVFEATQGIVRGSPGSEASAMIFGEFFPNPGGRPFTSKAAALISPETAFFIEALGTGILVLVILGVTNSRNPSRPGVLTAATIGLTITLLISLLGPLTMAGFNPARDFAPRVFSSLSGWGRIPFTTNGSGWFTVYIVAPVVGGQVGGLVYRFFFRPYFATDPAGSDPVK
jgi:glycerol uptake facilitator protein